MSGSGLLRRRTLAALAALTAAALSIGLTAGSSAAKPGKNQPHGPTIPVQILSFNDFHGNLEPPGGSSGRITTGYTETVVPNSDPVRYQATATTKDAGGVEYLATHLRNARKGHANTVTVAAGDIIGASPLLSAAFHDEPTIEAMNALGLEATSVGNHEFDEGYKELQRMQSGGCLPDGDGADNQNSCAAHTFAGANFQYLSANVKYSGTNKTILPPYWIKNMNGAKIGFIGMTLKETPTIVTKSGVEGLDFTDEVATANALVPVLHKKGVDAIVVLIHQGGIPAKTTFTGAEGRTYTVDPSYDYTCQGGGMLTADSPIIPIAENLDPAIDMVISGHTHQPYVCNIPDNQTHQPRLVTSASSFGRLYTETNLTFDRRTNDIVRASVAGSNMIVTRDVPKAADLTSLISTYQTLVAPIANRTLGTITADITRTPTTGSGETALGDLIADGQLNDPSVVTGGQPPVIAFMNPGGIRADLTYASSPKGEGDGVVTYEEAFTVQPFNNYVVSMDMTGANIYALLNQQWSGLNSGSGAKVLQVSSGFAYQWTPTPTPHVVPGSVTLDGAPIADGATYRIVANNFLSDGGDNFAAFTTGQNKYFGGLDIESFANYLEGHSPYSPTALDRIVLAP